MIAYLDASALVKLTRHERETGTLRAFVKGCDAVASEIVATETLRAVSRLADEIGMPLRDLVESALTALEEVALIIVETGTLVRAGLMPGAHLRSLDAIHIATAVSLGDVDVFITYDDRQAAAARLAGLRTASPGA